MWKTENQFPKKSYEAVPACQNQVSSFVRSNIFVFSKGITNNIQKLVPFNNHCSPPFVQLEWFIFIFIILLIIGFFVSLSFHQVAINKTIRFTHRTFMKVREWILILCQVYSIAWILSLITSKTLLLICRLQWVSMQSAKQEMPFPPA